ncbi:hypothetical protein RF11_11211 [Thelohanellus kitauei]|uniref:Uncharacterized protein n=1 Tax=Thelohanellus kitauei TaxID=669202 RepID=A0A0C2MZX0_THEKT|nr:hypothetical protein RF11_11211 [Thelohanellus kitauei]
MIRHMSEIFEDLIKIISTRSLSIKAQLDRIEHSSCVEEGNDVVEASNITEDVLLCVLHFCFRVVDISALVNVEVAKFIHSDLNECQKVDLSVLNRFDLLIYCDHQIWIALIKLLLTLTAFGNSKIVLRVCSHCFLDNHVKFVRVFDNQRISHIEKHPELYSGLIVHAFHSLNQAFKNKDLTYQAMLSVVNMIIFFISTFRTIYPQINSLIQTTTSFPSLQTVDNIINMICQSNIQLKEKRQGIIKIFNCVTDDAETLSYMINEFENLSVKTPNKPEKESNGALTDWEIVDIRFLFE